MFKQLHTLRVIFIDYDSIYLMKIFYAIKTMISLSVIAIVEFQHLVDVILHTRVMSFLSASLYVSKRGAY